MENKVGYLYYRLWGFKRYYKIVINGIIFFINDLVEIRLKVRKVVVNEWKNV